LIGIEIQARYHAAIHKPMARWKNEGGMVLLRIGAQQKNDNQKCNAMLQGNLLLRTKLRKNVVKRMFFDKATE